MTSTGRQITNLMMDTGKSAADMTHAVKVLGNGSMQQGFSRIGAFFSEEVATAAAKGLTTGRVQGGIVGMLGTAAVGGIIAFAVSKKRKKDAHEAEGQIILQTMQEKAPSPDNVSDAEVEPDDTVEPSETESENLE